MEKPYIAVVGGINLDVCGRAAAPLIPRDSNPGQVLVSVGGVGRNIAHNLCLLGTRVTMLTALAEDASAVRIRAACEAAGIHIL